jgi:hypothetical protein
MRVLDPFAVDTWIRATLLATAGKTAVVNDVVVPADAVALAGERIYPLRDDIEPGGWPYIVYQGASEYDRWAEEVLLANGEYSVRMVMRQDKLIEAGAAGMDVEDYNQAGYIAIHAAFDGVQFHDAGSGIVHGCEIVRPNIKLYGESRRKISEMGVDLRIVST